MRSLVLVILTMLVATGFATEQTVSTQPTAQNEDNTPLLGMVTLGKTTLDELAKSLKAKHCKYSRDSSTISVKAGCFKLPGRSKVMFAAFEPNKPIAWIELSYDRRKAPGIFKEYVEKLSERFGKPVEIKSEGKEGHYAKWVANHMVVQVDENNWSEMGIVDFATEDTFEVASDSLQKQL